MDKIAINNATIEHSSSNSLPKGIRPVHRKYGLWICKFCRESSGKPISPDALKLRQFGFYDLSHMYDGHGWYTEADGSIREVTKGEGILVSPGFRHKYGGLNANYVEDAISFWGPVADHLFSAGVIKNGILKIGRARRLLPIIELALDTSWDSQIKANMELQKLLSDLYFENKSKSEEENPEFTRLLDEIRKAPQRYWGLDQMSDFCGLSASQLNRIFRKQTGMTSKNYIDSVRMQLASEMLSENPRTIREIADRLGYPDPYHFSRRFKELKGYSPQKYREIFLM